MNKERKFEFKPEFKAMATEALTKMSFSQVHAIMKLVKRESNVYTEGESNAIVGFLGELPYRDVAHIFEAMPKLVTEVAETEGPQSEKSAVSQVAEEQTA